MAKRGPEVKAMKIWKKLLSGYQSPMLTEGDCGQEDDEGWNEESIRRRNAREPLLWIASNPILDDLLVMETGADGKGGKKGERSEGRMSDDNPAGGERDREKLAGCVVWHGREGREGTVCATGQRTDYIHRRVFNPASTPDHLGQCKRKDRTIIRQTALAHSNLNTQIHGSNEAGKVPSSL